MSLRINVSFRPLRAGVLVFSATVIFRLTSLNKSPRPRSLVLAAISGLRPSGFDASQRLALTFAEPTRFSSAE